MADQIRVCFVLAGVALLAACAARTADVKPNANASTTAAQHPACLTETGSRIARTDAQCSAFGRSYSSDDIDRTGATTAGEALRLLDPAVTVHR